MDRHLELIDVMVSVLLVKRDVITNNENKKKKEKEQNARVFVRIRIK